jgi:hypothetical protein
MTIALCILIALNIVLALGLGGLYMRAGQRIIDEKVATFGGCIATISLGLLREGRQRGTEAIIEGLRRMRGGLDGDELKYRLVRAASCRLQRNDIAFDMVGELAHVAEFEFFSSADEAERIADYVHDLDYSKGAPRELFGDDGLFRAEIGEEQYILSMYRAAVSKSKPNPFQRATSRLPVL